MRMFKYLLCCLFHCIALATNGQIMKPIKYRDPVFSAVMVQKNISYSEGPKPGIKKKFCLFDLYEPMPDSTLQRPLIIWLHGGGFKLGSKRAKGIQLWSESFAKRGYVCAALNYRLSKKNPLVNFITLKKSCYGAVQDVEQAVTYFKKNHARFRIDTNHIVLAGNSAGGMIALQSVYSSNAELAKLAQLPDANLASANHNPAQIAAVINFWGALFNINWLKNARIPIFSAHGSNDRTVPFDHRDTSLYGSNAIHNKATALNIPNGLKVYEGYSHELQKHFNPLFVSAATKQRWLEAGQFAADFLYEQLFK
ncbi:MAG: hypothetical protein NVS3B15_17460 [Sediminibacterium sp.]